MEISLASSQIDIARFNMLFIELFIECFIRPFFSPSIIVVDRKIAVLVGRSQSD